MEKIFIFLVPNVIIKSFRGLEGLRCG